MVDFDSNTGLVYKVLSDRYLDYPNDEEDLIQEGMMGLWSACQTYDPSRGVAFSTYATVCIRNSMGMYMRKELRHKNFFESLDDPINEDGTLTRIDLTVDQQDLDNREKMQKVQEILEIVDSTEYAELVYMKLEGLTQTEMARRLGVTPVTISERMHFLYKMVEKELEKRKLKNF